MNTKRNISNSIRWKIEINLNHPNEFDEIYLKFFCIKRFKLIIWPNFRRKLTLSRNFWHETCNAKWDTTLLLRVRQRKERSSLPLTLAKREASGSTENIRVTRCELSFDWKSVTAGSHWEPKWKFLDFLLDQHVLRRNCDLWMISESIQTISKKSSASFQYFFLIFDQFQWIQVLVNYSSLSVSTTPVISFYYS